MAKLTPKENFMRLFRHEIPEWVPSYSYFGKHLGVDEDPPNMSVRVSAMTPPGTSAEKSVWGVPRTSVEQVGGASLPTPNYFIIKDIREWRDIIKAPDISDIDWETSAKKDMENLAFSRDNVALMFGAGGGYFQLLMGFMGFNEGLTAMATEPETVKELFDYMHHEFYLPIATNYIDYVNPDIYSLADDSATERAPFISVPMFRDLLLPYYDDFARLARNRGIPVCFHNCGKAETLVQELVRIGISAWEAVQLENDIKGMQVKYGRSLIIGGGWEPRGHLIAPDVTDEEIRESARLAIDSFAGNGGYFFDGGFLAGSMNDEVTTHRNTVLQMEIHEYGHKFYK